MIIGTRGTGNSTRERIENADLPFRPQVWYLRAQSRTQRRNKPNKRTKLNRGERNLGLFLSLDLYSILYPGPQTTDATGHSRPL
jgi:hypothetical protein